MKFITISHGKHTFRVVFEEGEEDKAVIAFICQATKVIGEIPSIDFIRKFCDKVQDEEYVGTI